MSKPVVTITMISTDRKSRRAPALFDTGSFYTIVRRDHVPSSKTVLPIRRRLGTASRRGAVKVEGVTHLVLKIGDRMVETAVLVSPDLKREMIVGARTMQEWDITIRNRNGATRIQVGRDMRDPEITEVD